MHRHVVRRGQVPIVATHVLWRATATEVELSVAAAPQEAVTVPEVSQLRATRDRIALPAPSATGRDPGVAPQILGSKRKVFPKVFPGDQLPHPWRDVAGQLGLALTGLAQLVARFAPRVDPGVVTAQSRRPSIACFGHWLRQLGLPGKFIRRSQRQKAVEAIEAFVAEVEALEALKVLQAVAGQALPRTLAEGHRAVLEGGETFVRLPGQGCQGRSLGGMESFVRLGLGFLEFSE
mmetsp:Transcript_32206/g.51870  ORF Transcript_32206/g.51870 Transcript_32206/m.51870 type:complete len:235 (-) Transcript_32206:124-828(-)